MRRTGLLFAGTLVVLCMAVGVGWGRDALSVPGTEVGQTAMGRDRGVYVWVPAGEFVMGSPAGEGEPGEHPAHRVRITKGFWLSRCEVTLGQWRAYCRKARIRMWGGAPSDSHPVQYVSWEYAKAYCRQYGLALPTEAQWEYAARGPEGRTYPWGDYWDKSKCCNWDNKGPGGGDMGTPFPVGSLPQGASWCGALDMAGNEMEWCNDWFDEKYYMRSPTEDPRGPDSGSERVVRSGPCFDDARGCRAASRSSNGPGGLSGNGGPYAMGFRPSRTP